MNPQLMTDDQLKKEYREVYKVGQNTISDDIKMTCVFKMMELKAELTARNISVLSVLSEE